MQKILFLLFLSIATYTSTFAQTPVVIKQDSTVKDLDDEEEYECEENAVYTEWNKGVLANKVKKKFYRGDSDKKGNDEANCKK